MPIPTSESKTISNQCGFDLNPVEIKEEPVIKEESEEDDIVDAVPASRPRHNDSIDSNCNEDSDGLDINELNLIDIESEVEDEKNDINLNTHGRSIL